MFMKSRQAPELIWIILCLKNMHINILTNHQLELLDYIKQFKRSFYLVGGTAMRCISGTDVPLILICLRHPG